MKKANRTSSGRPLPNILTHRDDAGDNVERAVLEGELGVYIEVGHPVLLQLFILAQLVLVHAQPVPPRRVPKECGGHS